VATHLIKIACEAATGRRAGISVFGTDYPTRDGTCVRDFIDVTDLADAHVAVYRNMRANNASGIFNCGNGTGYTVLEVLRAVEREVGHPLMISYGARRAGDPPELVADPSLLQRTLPWRPKRTLGDMLASALAWERRVA
jgi:UDP-glucose 4-epimerase